MHELHTIGQCLDDLVSGRVGELGDKLMQRLKAIQRAHIDGNWATASHLEVGAAEDVSLVTPAELCEATAGQMVAAKLREDVAKAGKKGGAGPP